MPGWNGGEECGIRQVSGCAELPVKLPSSERDSAKVPFCLLWVKRARETFIIDRVYAGDAVSFQYADDTQILVSGPRNDLSGLISRMEVSLASLNEWFNAHALKVNTTKTQLMVFGSRQIWRNLPDFTISFCDAELQPSAQVRNLGVVFDGALSWEAHVSELSRSCTGMLIGLSHARHCLPDGVLKTIVTALVISRIQYCFTVYGNGSQKKLRQAPKNIQLRC